MADDDGQRRVEGALARPTGADRLKQGEGLAALAQLAQQQQGGRLVARLDARLLAGARPPRRVAVGGELVAQEAEPALVGAGDQQLGALGHGFPRFG